MSCQWRGGGGGEEEEAGCSRKNKNPTHRCGEQELAHGTLIDEFGIQPRLVLGAAARSVRRCVAFQYAKVHSITCCNVRMPGLKSISFLPLSQMLSPLLVGNLNLSWPSSLPQRVPASPHAPTVKKYTRNALETPQLQFLASLPMVSNAWSQCSKD